MVKPILPKAGKATRKMIEKITSFEYNEPLFIKIDGDMAQERADKILSCVLEGYSRSFIQSLFSDSLVHCSGKCITKSYRPKTGDVIEFTVKEPEEISLEKENIPLDIVYEDECMLVVNKQKGLVVHPAPGHTSGTLVNALLYHCDGKLSGINGAVRPGIVHRIDKDTSGLLLVAKNDAAHLSLSEQIREHTFHREYRTVVHGTFKDAAGTVNAPIGRSTADRKKMCVTDKNSKSAVTHYEVLQTFDKFSYLKCVLETGRTHQIRVHMAYLGHPVAGDPVYGPKNGVDLGGQCLHAAVLEFDHPLSGERIRLEAPLPDWFEAFLTKIEHTRG